MTYSSCLHDQQDLCWGNTSRDTSEELQESQAMEFKELSREHQGKKYMATYTNITKVCILVINYLFVKNCKNRKLWNLWN